MVPANAGKETSGDARKVIEQSDSYQAKRISFSYRCNAKSLDEIPALRLVIAGEGPYRAVLEKQILHLGLQDHVRLIGNQPDPRSCLEKMDLFVLPSLVEGLPTVIIESMARGVPVVASDIPGNNELVVNGKTGWLFRSRSDEDLAKIIVKAFSDPLLSKDISAQAYSWALNLTIQNAVKQYIEQYEQLFKDQDQDSL